MDTSSLQAGFVTSRFRLVSLLASGGMGVTYRAWDEAMGTPVVVKIPKQTLLNEPGFLERFDREIRSSAALVHPHIVPVISFGVDDGVPFIAMRFLPGGSLAHRIPRDGNGMPKQSAAATLHTWLPGIAAALDFAHDNLILHRDVKPANIFFDGFSKAFLGDFGLAKVIEDSTDSDQDAALTATNVAMGTQHYMAPERLSPHRAVDRRSDQYSLAVAAFELLAGRRPFLGQTAHIVVEQATMPPPPLGQLRPDLPASTCSALHRGLAKNPADRFATCREFAEAVLRQIPPPAVDMDFARLLCPACSKLLKLPTSAGGKRGACSKCSEPLVIAPDLGALWLVSEHAPAADEPDLATLMPYDSRSQPIFMANTGKVDFSSGPLRLAIAAATIIVVGLLTMAVAPSISAWLAAEWQDAPPPHTPPSLATPPPRIDPGTPPPKPQEPISSHSPEDLASLPPPSDATADPPLASAAAPVSLPPPPVPASPSPAAPQPPPVDRPRPAPLLAEIEWARVANPGNDPDENGRGHVPHAFVLSRHEITNEQFCRFLNGSVAGRQNRHGVADCLWPAANASAVETASCGIVPEAAPDGAFTYRVAPNMARKPVTGIRWCDAARFCNWLHNGGADDSDTENGAYRLAGRAFGDKEATPHEPDAAVWIPTVDEWYKAAYHKAAQMKPAYWDFPFASNRSPKPTTATDNGDGNRAVDGDSANFNLKAVWKGTLNAPLPAKDFAAVTTVGTNGGASPYGLMDMGGNASELATFVDPSNGLAEAWVCGGDYRSKTARALSSAALSERPASKRGGLRLARPDAPTLGDTAPPQAPAVDRVAVRRALTSLSRHLAIVPQAARATPEALTAVQAGIQQIPTEALPDEVVALAAETSVAVEAAERVIAARVEKRAQLMVEAESLKRALGKDIITEIAVGVPVQIRESEIEAAYTAEMTPIYTTLATLQDRCASLLKKPSP